MYKPANIYERTVAAATTKEKCEAMCAKECEFDPIPHIFYT